MVTYTPAAATPTLGFESGHGLTGMSTTYGTPGSTPGYVTLTGANLQSGNVTVAAPTGFEVCKTIDGTYASSVPVTPSSGSIAGQVIYVRLTGAEVGTPSGDISAYGAGVAQGSAATVGVSGTVTCFDGPSVNDSNTSDMEMDLRWTAVAGATSYKVEVSADNFSGGGGATTVWSEGFSSGPAASGWTFSGVGQYTGAAYIGDESPAVKFDSANDYIISAEFASGGGTLTWMMYLNGTSTSVMTVEESANGSTWGNAQTYSMSVQEQNTYTKTLQNATKYVRWTLTTRGSNVSLDDVSLTRTSGGSLVAEGTRTTGGTATGDGTWTVSGTSWKWTWDAGDAGEEAGTYYYRVTAVGGECSVPCTVASVTLEEPAGTPTITVSPASVSGLTTTLGSASGASSKITVTADSLTAGISASVTGNIQISTDGSTWGTTASWGTSGGDLYVRLAGTAVTAANASIGTVTLTSTGATDKTVTVSGTVNAITKPTGGTATQPTGVGEGRVTVPWTSSYTVLVVRYVSGGTPAAPANGTAYSTGSGLNGQIVYKGSAGSYTDSALSAGDNYDYWLYAVNNDYYSEGTKVSGTASKAPVVSTTATLPASGTAATAGTVSFSVSAVPSSGVTWSATCTAGGAASSTYSVSGGVFSFTPASSGSYTFQVTANNGVTPNGTYSFTVNAKPAALTLGATAGATPGTVTLTVSGAETGASVNVRRYTTSAAASSDTTGTGGTQLTAVNANGTFTDSGLDGCTTYYYKGWQSKGGQTSAATEVKSAKTALAAPGNVDADYAIVDGEPVITVTWDDVAGASSYLVQVATDDDFTEDVPGTPTVHESAALQGNTMPTGWTKSSSGTGTKDSMCQVASGSNPGWVQTKEYTGLAGKRVDLQFKSKIWPGDTGNILTVTVIGGGTWGTSGSATWAFEPAAAVTDYSNYVDLDASTGTIQFKFSAESGKRVCISTVVVSSPGQSVSGSIVSSGTVGSGVGEYSTGSGEVEFDEDYYYRVQAISTGECEEWSDPEGPLTPIEANAAPVWKTIAAVTRTLAAGQMSKDMKAELSTAGIPAPTFSVTMNTGSATPAGSYAVDRDTGVFTYTPALADAGKTFTFKFTASNSEGSPTQTMAVTVTAGSLTLTGSFSTFNAAAGAASLAQSVTLTGSNLGNGETVTVAVGSPFEVSLTGNDNDYAASKTVTATSAGAIAGQLVYVRVAASASPGNGQTGTLSAHCTSAGGAGSAVTKSLTANVSGESTATSIEKSFIVVNNGSSDEWYNGSGTDQTYNFSERYLGEYTSLKLAAEAGTRNDNTAAGHVVTMNYTVDSGTVGSWSTLTMPWKEWDDPLNKHQSHDGAGNLVYTPDLASGRAPGLYYIRVFFSQVTTGGTIYDSRNNQNYVASFRVPLTTPSISSVTTAGAGTLTGADSGATYVVVRKTGDSGWGTPSGGLPTVGNDNWCGGTVVYVGTAASFTDTTAAGCASYYYKVWTKAASEDVWSAGSAVYGAVTMATPAAPVLNAIADLTTTHNQFVATWGAVQGAVKYRLDVMTSVAGNLTETFNSATFGGGTSSSYLTRSITDGDLGTWSATQCRSDKTDIDGKAPLIASGGTLTSPAMAKPFTSVSFDYAWPFSESGSVTIKAYVNDVEQDSQSLSTAAGGTATFTISGSAGDVVKFSNTGTKDKRLLIDNITFSCSTVYVTGYENKDVGDVTTYTVTGLGEQTTYYVRVKAEGSSTSCTSVWSNVESVTTKPDTSLTDVTIANFDADGESEGSNVGTGSVLAGGTVLLQGTKLAVASGSVNPTLTGVSFGTTGSATGSDIGTFRVRIGTTAAYGGNETVFGTATGAAAGTQSASGSATLTAGTTYYVWIEAVTLAGATAGNGVAVSALTAESFTTTGARKTGSSAAAGAQTIYGAPTVSLTQGASGSAKITGTVGGLATGATVELRRYESAEAASGDTAGTAGTAVTVTGGAFEATGLEACRPYWFKARQTLNGYTGAWGAAATATAPGLTAPTGLAATPGTTGAALTWDAVAGALGYSVSVWHYEGGGGKSTATYTVAGKTSVTTGGTLPDGAGQTFSSTYSTVGQMTSGNSQTLTLTGFGGTRITGITLSMKSNSSGGAGTLTLQVGSGAAQTLASGAFNTSAWNGDWSTSYVDVVKTLGSPVMVDDGESVVIQIAASANSLYCQSYTVKYETGTPAYDVLAGTPASGVTFTPGAGASATVGGLDANSEYQWSVAATGFGECAGDGATSSFTTLEVAGAPVIATPLTSAVEQLSGTITGTPGATMILKRYDTAEGAAAGAAGGSLGGVVVSTTEGTGASAGTWTFTDTPLLGCKTYYYKAWQVVTVDGVAYTSAGSDVASGKTGLGTPTLVASGAGTQMTISWNAVPGAVSYYLEVATDNQFSRPTSGDAVLTEDFAGFTGTAEVTNLDSVTTETGWSGSKVYAGAGTARLGTSNNSGYLTTKRIGALANGGTVYFDLKQYKTGEGATLTVQISYPEEEGEDEEWIDLKTVTPTDDFDTYSVTLPAGAKTSDFWICFDTVSSKRVYLDNVRIVPVGTGSTGSLVYEATVTGAPLSRTADGLTVGETYYFRVTTTGGEECETVTPIGSDSTADAPMITVSPNHYNYGTVNKNEGGKMATFTVRNTGSVALKFNAVTLVQDGDAYEWVSPATASARTADLAAGQSRTYTVKFDPQVSGPRTATLRFGNNAYNVTHELPGDPMTYANLDIPLTGTCYDPSTAEPTVYWMKVEDELGIEDTVTDHSMALEATEPVLTVLTWHYNRSYRTLDGSSKAAKWTLLDPNGDVVVTTGGTRLENRPFTAVEDYVYDGKTCAKFSAPIPALGNGNAIRGTYHVRVKVYDSTGTYWTETTQFVPVETGWLFEDFTRADTEATGSGALENGWTAMAQGGAVVGEAAIHADALELYGANGEFTGEAGRIAVARDMSDVGYATNPHDFEGTGSWGFHFRTGAKTVGFDNGSTAGAFVLGSTKSTWLSADDDQVGYAVAMMGDAVRLVKFERSLLAGGTITQLGSAEYASAQGKLLAVRVDFLPGQDAVDADGADDGVAHDAVPAKFRLYVKEVAATGGSPIAECGAADKVLEYEFAAAETHDLKYAGMMWNHGVAQASDKTGAMFDDIYLPHMTSQTEPMMFHVIDEDTEGPTFEDFDLPAAVAASTVNGSGLTVHGTVADPSGIWTTATGGSAPSWDAHAADPKWELWVDGAKQADGKGTFSPDGNGAGTSVAWTIEIPSGLSLPTTTACELRLSAWDHDIDREDDSTQGTAVLPFTLCAATPTAPGWATLEGDGAEMAVLRWARTAGTTYVVVRSDAEIGERATPPEGTTGTPVAGTTVYEGLGKVVYLGTGDDHLTGTWTAREFIVAPGSTNYFAVYGMTGDSETGYYFSAPTLPKAYQWTTSTTNTETGAVTVTSHTATNSSGVPKEGSVTDGVQPLVTPKYEPGEGVDAFAYRTSVPEIGETDPQRLALAFNAETRPETGSGWAAGGWTESAAGTWKIHDTSLPVGETDYPEPAGNKLYWQDASGAAAGLARIERTLDSPASGDFFVAALVNYQYPGDKKWVNIVLLDESDNVIASFGKQGGSGVSANAAILVPKRFGGGSGDETISVPEYNLSQPTFQLAPEQEATEAGYIGNDYVIVGQVSKSENRFRLWAYYAGPIPETPNNAQKKAAMGRTYNDATRQQMLDRSQIPQIFADPEGGACATNQVTASWYKAGLGDSVGNVAKIRLEAGSDADMGVLGHVYFDEVRFAGSWEELFLFNAPEVFTFDFNKPEEGTGILVGTDTEGHRLWKVSDGALAHGNVGLNAQFGLYHRTGIQSASFTIKDDDGHTLLKQASDLALVGDAAGRVDLSGRSGAAYSDWKTGTGGAKNVAIPTNWIALDSNYVVEVTLKSAGGKEAVVTAASETGGGGATDLFLGEFGEGSGGGEKYVEIYNGTGHDLDLSDYYIARSNPKGSSVYGDDAVANTWTNDYYNAKWYKWEKISATPRIMHHKTTVVLLSNLAAADLKSALEEHCEVIQMTTDVVNSGGKSVIALFKAADIEEPDENGICSPTNKPWLDACGLSLADEHFIQSRLEDTKLLPRPAPDELDPNEWDYRPWRADGSDTGYTNILATAGVYDRNIGLGGNMEFKVYDDDIEAPALVSGGLRVRKADGTLEEEYRAVSAGDRTFVVGGWSFTNYPAAADIGEGGLTLEQYQWIAGMWPGGLTQNGGVSWSSELGGTDLAGWANVIEAGDNKGQSNVEFDGISQRKYGNMIARASASYAQDDEVWLGFDLDVAQLTEAVLTFGFAGGNAGFKSARVEWSATGEEGSFTMPNEWNFDPNSGGATTWTEYSRSLDPATTGIPASAGHLWFRVYLSDYGTTSGTFRMDNMRVEGAPSVVRVTDAEICSRGMQFEVHVKDEASGLDAGTTGAQSGDDGKAYFDCGLEMDEYRTVTLANGGKAESTITWTAADGSGNEVTTGWGPLTAQNWYEDTQAGHGKLRMSVPDADDDRPGDQTVLSTDFGMLMVEDDDVDPPALSMETMKPRQEGTMAQWLLAEKTAVPSETMEALSVGSLGLNTTEGTTSKPRYSLRSAAETGLTSPTYAVYQSGWQAGSKFWTVRIKNLSAGAGTISKVSFASKVGSVLAPTSFEVKYGTVTAGVFGGEESATWTGSLLTSGEAWVKEGAEGASGSPIRTWASHEKTVDIPLAASGSAGDEVEIRIYGKGGDPKKGIGATWYLWDLKFEGTVTAPGEGGSDGYTYVTDNSLSGGTNLPMHGYVWDSGSGLAAVPTYELKRGNTTVSSGSITFKAERALSARTAKELGEFEQDIAVSGLGYGDLSLAEYKGTVHAVDADADRNSAADGSGTNYDAQELDGQFAFTVVDQDLVGPSAPANVAVNGVSVPNAAPEYGTPAWDAAPWTNKREFLVSFDVANDVAPTEAQLTGSDETSAAWRTAHGVTNGMVKKASLQTGVSGVGEYRVALATTAAAMSNAPSFSVAVTNGALANYGFERGYKGYGGDIGWTCAASGSGIGQGDKVGGVYPVAEGTNSFYLQKHQEVADAEAVQVIPFEASESAQTLTVDLKLKIFKRSKDSIVYAKFEFSADGENWTPAGNATGVGEGGDTKETWVEKTMGTKTLAAAAGMKYLRFTLYSNSGTANIDDVRLSVRVGAAPAEGTADRATMRYVADAAAQGMNTKYVYAVDADNDRKQDRMLGETAVFYTPFDCTPPTAVAFTGHGTGASADTDDPTTQFDLTWLTSGVGPDDTGSDEYAAMPSANKRGVNSLSPWGTFRVYYRTYDPVALEAAATDARASSTAEYLYRTLVRGPADGWNGSGEDTLFYRNPALGWKHVENGDEIEDVTAPAVDGKRKYSGWNTIGSGAQQTVRLYDLDFDQEYLVVVVGVDKAGNEGPVSSTSWATNNTIKFSITRGWHVPKTEAETAFGAANTTHLTNDVVSALKWTAAGSVTTNEVVVDGEIVQAVTTNVTKDYDLLQWDARSFRESPDNDWKLIGSVRSDWFVDDGGPTNRGAIRFYRASYKDRWKRAVTNATTGQVTAQTPLVSEEVYAQTAIPLRSGPKTTNTYVNQEEGNQNFVALHGVPYTNTFRAVFGGLETFPGGKTSAEATCIDFYTPGTNAIARESYFLKEDGEWYLDGVETPCSDVLRDRNFFTRAFSINLPYPIPPNYVAGIVTNWHGKTPVEVPYMLWKPILQVPTNGFSQSIVRGTPTAPVYNIVALRLPVAAHPSQMNLVTPIAGSSGTEGLYIGHSRVADQIYTIDPITREPGQACYCRWEVSHVDSVQNDVTNTVAVTNLVWRFVKGDGLVPDGYFKPNDVLVIRSRYGGDADREENRTWTWTYHPTNFYSLPHRHMQAGK